MTKSLLMKSLLLLFALVVGTGSSWAATGDVKVTISYTDIPDGYTKDTGTSGSFTKTVSTANDLTVYYAGINTKSSATAADHAYGYAMFLKNAGFMYSSAAPTGYYPSKVTVTFGSNTGTSGKAGINYGTASLNTRNSSVNGSVTKGGTCELTNSDQTKCYWNFSTTGANVQVDNIEVVYSLKAGVNPPTFSPVAGEVAKGTKVTLTQATADQIRYTLDGTAPTKTTGTVYSAPIEINAATTIKAIAIKGDEVSGVVEASYTVVLPAVLTLDFTDAGWGFPSDYVTTEESYTNGGYTITVNAANGHKKIMNNTEIASLLFGRNGATITLPAFGFNVSKLKVYGYSGAGASITFNVFVGTTAVSTEATSSKVDHEFVIAADKQAAGTIYTIKATNSNNCQISKIEVYGDGCEAGLVGDAGWATYVTTAPVAYLDGDAFAVTSVGSAVELTSVTSVPTGTPVLLKGASQKTAALLDAEPAAITNKLAVSDGTKGTNDFVLAKHSGKVGFYKWTGAALADGKVYLPASEVSSARDFIGFDSDDVTGVNNINSDAKTIFNGDFFNLAGQRVAKPAKGLYIVNGKKVIIK